MKAIIGPIKSHPTSPTEPRGKCGRTNHTIQECYVGMNECMWCDSSDHLIVACPRRLKAIEKGAVRPLAALRQGNPGL